MDEEQKQQIQQMIDQALKGSFTIKKIGDMPTDDIQLTPKRYVDQEISSVISVISSISGGITSLIGMIATDNIFGDGSDGSGELTGSSVVGFASIVAANTYNLTRDVYAQNLTVSSTVTLNTQSYRIFASSVFTNQGIVQNKGGNATNATSGSPGNAGSTPPLGVFRGGSAGVAGATVDPAAVVSSWGGKGGDGGGGSGKTNGGSVFGVFTRPLSPGFLHLPFDLKNGTTSVLSGGSGGGFGGTGAIGNNAGGASGGGGGIIMIAAKALLNQSSVVATGGNGGAGFYDGLNPPGGGGGGGGGGGAIFTFFQSSIQGALNVAGGNGGAASGGGSSGGGSGNVGSIYSFQVQT